MRLKNLNNLWFYFSLASILGLSFIIKKQKSNSQQLKIELSTLNQKSIFDRTKLNEYTEALTNIYSGYSFINTNEINYEKI